MESISAFCLFFLKGSKSVQKIDKKKLSHYCFFRLLAKCLLFCQLRNGYCKQSLLFSGLSGFCGQKKNSEKKNQNFSKLLVKANKKVI
jgi:hypothetical protein